MLLQPKISSSTKKLQVQTEAAEKRTKMLRKEYEESVKATGENSKESKNYMIVCYKPKLPKII